MTDSQYITLIVLIVILSVVPWAILLFFGKRINKFFRRRKNKRQETLTSIQEITSAIQKLAKIKRGATIAIKQNSELDNSVIIDPTVLNAHLSSELLVNIFEGNKSPLHDGIVIIDGTTLVSAAGTITNISGKKLPKTFGSRHRSALGLSEKVDAIIVVLSEERQHVTIFKDGTYNEIKDLNNLRTEITNFFIEKDDNSSTEEE